MLLTKLILLKQLLFFVRLWEGVVIFTGVILFVTKSDRGAQGAKLHMNKLCFLFWINEGSTKNGFNHQFGFLCTLGKILSILSKNDCFGAKQVEKNMLNSISLSILTSIFFHIATLFLVDLIFYSFLTMHIIYI